MKDNLILVIIFGILIVSFLLLLLDRNDSNKLTPEKSYSLGWRDGFYRGLQKQDWTQKEWRDQAKEDSIIFFNDIK